MPLPAAIQDVCRRVHSHAGARHRRQRRGVQSRERRAPASAPVLRERPARVDPAARHARRTARGGAVVSDLLRSPPRRDYGRAFRLLSRRGVHAHRARATCLVTFSDQAAGSSGFLRSGSGRTSANRAVLWLIRRSAGANSRQKAGRIQPSSIHSRLIVDSRSPDESFETKADAPAPRNAWLVAGSAIAVNMITFVVGFTRRISRHTSND